MAKLYVRTDENSNIIYGYTNAFGYQPADDDTCIMDDDAVIHFMIDGEINPPLFNENDQPLYKLVNGVPVRRTDEEIVTSIITE